MLGKSLYLLYHIPWCLHVYFASNFLTVCWGHVMVLIWALNIFCCLALCDLLLHAECNLLNYCVTPLYYTLASLATCSSGDPVLGTLSTITVLSRIPTSATLHLGFPLILHCTFYPFFPLCIFVLWFVIFGKLILCSIHGLYLGCELWALLISWLRTSVAILRIFLNFKKT